MTIIFIIIFIAVLVVFVLHWEDSRWGMNLSGLAGWKAAMESIYREVTSAWKKNKNTWTHLLIFTEAPGRFRTMYCVILLLLIIPLQTASARKEKTCKPDLLSQPPVRRGPTFLKVRDAEGPSKGTTSAPLCPGAKGLFEQRGCEIRKQFLWSSGNRQSCPEGWGLMEYIRVRYWQVCLGSVYSCPELP